MKICKLINSLFSSKNGEKKYSLEEQSCLENAQKCLKAIEDGTLDIAGARWFLHVLPTHYFKQGRYKEEVHNFCNDCHRNLWLYCLKKGYIDNIDYEEFTEHGMVHFKDLLKQPIPSERLG